MDVQEIIDLEKPTENEFKGLLTNRNIVRQVNDRFGYPRIPSFWYTLNLPFTYLFEIHRFWQAVEMLKDNFRGNESEEVDDQEVSPEKVLRWSHEQRSERFEWVLENCDIVSLIHAVRVELIITQVMKLVIPPDNRFLFHHWARFEFGSSGNPHAHGINFVPNNPEFECVKDEEAKQALIEKGHPNPEIVEHGTRQPNTWLTSSIRMCKNATQG